MSESTKANEIDQERIQLRLYEKLWNDIKSFV